MRLFGAPGHPQTQGKIEHWHETLNNRILLEKDYFSKDLGGQIAALVDRYITAISDNTSLSPGPHAISASRIGMRPSSPSICPTQKFHLKFKERTSECH